MSAILDNNIQAAMFTSDSEEDFAKVLPKHLSEANKNRLLRAFRNLRKVEDTKEKVSNLPDVSSFLPKSKMQRSELWLLNGKGHKPIATFATEDGAIGQKPGTSVHKLRTWLSENPAYVSKLDNGEARIVKVYIRDES